MLGDSVNRKPRRRSAPGSRRAGPRQNGRYTYFVALNFRDTAQLFRRLVPRGVAAGKLPYRSRRFSMRLLQMHLPGSRLTSADPSAPTSERPSVAPRICRIEFVRGAPII
jgi:hypothetical protein